MTLPTERRSDPVARNVLSEQVKDRILQWILEGELAPGSRIIETRVARELGVSQAPVREALRDLTTLGVVEMQPYRGASVRQPSKTDLVEAMEVRAELEALAARQAATRMTQACLDELQDLIDEMHRLAEAGDAHGHALNNTAFHGTVVRASGNKTLLRMWSMLEPYARTYVTAMLPGTDLVWLGDRHSAIVEALTAGDPEQAAETMRVHAREAEELVLAMDEAAFGGAEVNADL
ncbi:MAG: GntR family transcriptional regulator [Acidimicrobiia bacterium]|nr:GntR family transcriptional regulator [Acidimicrobiia bacterium]